MPSKKDITGNKYGRLTAIRCTGLKTRHGFYLWECKCECGGCTISTVNTLNSGSVKSCGCLTTLKHGLSNSKPYRSWRRIKERCFNVGCKEYQRYGAKGITMCDEFKDDFQAFYEHMGNPPEDTRNWSIDRIDSSVGYEPGNMRWASPSLQARNRGRQSRNSSGVNGVSWREEFLKDGVRSNTYAIAHWIERHDGCGRNRSKSFNVSTYGVLPAFAMACQYREARIRELNEQGYGYSENHGK